MNLALPEIDQRIRLHFDCPMTDEELMRFCAENELLRIERDANGELIIMSPTGTDGGGTELEVGTDLNLWARQDGRGKALGPNAGVKLPDTSVRAADAAWASWERYNAAPGRGYKQLVPEFVIEVRSESDKLADRREKMNQWIANGVDLAWLLDPSRKVVEIYRPGREVLEGGSVVEAEGPVAGFVLELGKVWESVS
jgi:Uma2 family endonuclease